MPETCCAVGCSNRRGRKEGLSFHRFPEDEERRRKWVAAVNRKDWHPTNCGVYRTGPRPIRAARKYGLNGSAAGLPPLSPL